MLKILDNPKTGHVYQVSKRAKLHLWGSLCCFPRTKGVKEVIPSVRSEFPLWKLGRCPIPSQTACSEEFRKACRQGMGRGGDRQGKGTSCQWEVFRWHQVIQFLFIVPSYLSSKLPERTLSCLRLDLACFFYFFGGFGFLHLIEQALTLAEWG